MSPGNPAVFSPVALGRSRLQSLNPLRLAFTAREKCKSGTKGCIMIHYKVGYLVGSLATASINRKLARA